MTKRGKQASRKAAARKYGFLEVPLSFFFMGSYDTGFFRHRFWSDSPCMERRPVCGRRRFHCTLFWHATATDRHGHRRLRHLRA
ncbi:MAG: hypothetical protein Q8K59_06310 [Nitrosomonas sp.]|nr:hypothetical protein [Nitrosomonas sp.]